MFERYTENARRSLFFARYEATQLGDLEIKAEHVLLGLVRSTAGVAARVLADCGVSLQDIRREIEQRSQFREKVSTSVEIPFSSETKRILQYAAEEADRLTHRHIGTEHLLLGILREEKSETSKLLAGRGLRLSDARELVRKLASERPPASNPSEVSALTAGLNQILDRLSALAGGKTEDNSLIDEIRERVKRLEQELGP